MKDTEPKVTESADFRHPPRKGITKAIHPRFLVIVTLSELRDLAVSGLNAGLGTRAGILHTKPRRACLLRTRPRNLA